MARKIDVKVAAQLAEMPVDEFLYLNPQHNRPVIAGADDYALLLPIDKAELFAAKLQLTNQPLVSWQAYRMRNGETLQQVAAKFGLEVEGLRAVNGIGAKAKVPAGHTLLVPMQGTTEAARRHAFERRLHDRPPGPDVLLSRQARRNAGGHCDALFGVAGRPQALERSRRRTVSWPGRRCASRAISRRLPARRSARAGSTSKRTAGTIPKRTAGTIPTRTADTSPRATGNAKPAVATKASGKTTAKPAPVKKGVPVAKAGAAAGG